jgi:hypothetical protein
MPSETLWLDTESYGIALTYKANNEDVENISQAVQQLIKEYKND